MWFDLMIYTYKYTKIYRQLKKAVPVSRRKP